MEGAVHTPPKQTFGAEQFPTLWPLTVQASPSAIALLRHWDDLEVTWVQVYGLQQLRSAEGYIESAQTSPPLAVQTAVVVSEAEVAEVASELEAVVAVLTPELLLLLSELAEAVEAELSELLLLVELAESVPQTPALVQVSPLVHLPSLLPQAAPAARSVVDWQYQSTAVPQLYWQGWHCAPSQHRDPTGWKLVMS